MLLLELSSASADNPLAQGFNAVVVGERLYKILGLAAFIEIAPDHFVFAVEAQVFFDGTAGPHPYPLFAKFFVNIPDGFLRFGHGGHHGIYFCCWNVAVLVYGASVDESQVLLEGEFAEQV